MKLSEELKARGFIYQHTADLTEILDGSPRTVYLGIDPTADSIHLGNLVPYMLLIHLANAGHRVILLLGGGTALIGDPSGRDTERELSDPAVVEARTSKLKEQIVRLTQDRVMFVNNFDWLSQLSAIEFLRDVGKYFTVNAMIKKDAVATRMESEQGISYTEFSYALLQSYDFYHLHKTYGCDLQIGGSDQWGNLVSGVDYIRRVTGSTVYALTMSLVVDKVTGKKYGKSMGNAVWLDQTKTSPFELYQFLYNTSDENVIDHLKLFTFLSLEKITDLHSQHCADPARRLAQQTLAYEVVKFVHGEEVALRVEQVTKLLFGDVQLEDFPMVDRSHIMAYAPLRMIKADQPLVDVLVQINLASSKREAREFILGGAVMVGSALVVDTESTVTRAQIGSGTIIRRGKKQRVFVALQE
jgi:tyrosyl-tRNA synthetase